MRSRRSLGGWWRAEAPTPPAGCVTLGSGQAVAIGVGSKAALLDRAARAGLDVPPGVVVLDDADIPEGTAISTAVGATHLAVRSAFSFEDGDQESHAGYYRTELRVEADEIGAAVERVRASAANRTDTGRRDVLVMAMVDAVHAGVAFSEPGTYDDLVNLTTGTAEHLVAGDEAGGRTVVPRLERAEPGMLRRLQHLLRGVRREFGDEPWDVEWADDGTRCWLVQIRPITRPSLRNEALTIANHAEILPALPSPLMTSVIAEAGPDLFGWYRRFDPSLPADRSFLEVVAGRPFINLSLLEDLLRHLGLPTKLVADSIGGPPEHPRPARPLRMLRTSPALVRMGLAQIGAVVRATRNEARAAARGSRPLTSFEDALTELHDAYVGLVTGMFPLSSAIGPPLAVLRRAGTLVEHASRHRTVTTELAHALDVARRGDDLHQLLERFGHRGVYESDIARPRFRDDPSLLGARHDTAQVEAPRPPARTVRGRLTRPVWALAAAPLAARERLRNEAMRGFAAIRDQLVGLAHTAVDDGRLPTVDHLWMLDADEVRRLDQGWRPDESFWADRSARLDGLRRLDPPPIVHRFDDPADWSHDAAPAADRLHGLPLTRGTVRGSAWVLREPSLDLPEGFEPETTVLIARSVDAGWIPTLTLVSAVVVETGGDLSHGSILLRERGIPAVTNVRGATRAVSDGDVVEVRAQSGVVERVAATSG